ncbi:hypothetical protein, partial [Mesorhizobium sp.]|uniref:hypothetical protein n=1 Tax=Mesorhizobium sp. TaxID=1871066 RepID=UPI00257D1F48
MSLIAIIFSVSLRDCKAVWDFVSAFGARWRELASQQRFRADAWLEQAKRGLPVCQSELLAMVLQPPADAGPEAIFVETVT